jgi:hypothetical protein
MFRPVGHHQLVAHLLSASLLVVLPCPERTGSEPQYVGLTGADGSPLLPSEAVFPEATSVQGGRALCLGTFLVRRCPWNWQSCADSHCGVMLVAD